MFHPNSQQILGGAHGGIVGTRKRSA